MTEDIATASEQVRAARALLGWSQDHLAQASKVPKRLLDKLERGDGRPQRRTLVMVRRALEAEGVEFVEKDDEESGVRLRSKAGE